MNRNDVLELHYMTPRANLRSIAEHGILSHARAARVAHESVALEVVQDLRAGKTVPRGRPLHEYVNLYFDARNAMMYSRRSADLIVLRVTHEVLDWPGVVVTDGNSANNPTRFYPVWDGIPALDHDRVYAESWTHEDEWEQRERKRQRQAEVLVPDHVPTDAILGCYARTSEARMRCQSEVPGWLVEVNQRVYFDV